MENVSWHEAMEFCARLSASTGRTYTLPSEAQWEYACRAGSETAFHFGSMITAELANYRSNASYDDGPTHKSPGKTTAVGQYPANDFGLCDMHGNVWEWCLDHWQGDYDERMGVHGSVKKSTLIDCCAVVPGATLRGIVGRRLGARSPGRPQQPYRFSCGESPPGLSLALFPFSLLHYSLGVQK